MRLKSLQEWYDSIMWTSGIITKECFYFEASMTLGPVFLISCSVSVFHNRSRSCLHWKEKKHHALGELDLVSFGALQSVVNEVPRDFLNHLIVYIDDILILRWRTCTLSSPKAFRQTSVHRETHESQMTKFLGNFLEHSVEMVHHNLRKTTGCKGFWSLPTSNISSLGVYGDTTRVNQRVSRGSTSNLAENKRPPSSSRHITAFGGVSQCNREGQSSSPATPR